VVRVLERVARLDAEQRLVRARVLMTQVVDVARGDERQARRARQLGELRVDPLLDLEACVLDLDVGRPLAEELGEAVEVGLCVLRSVLFERPRDPSGEAT